MPGRVFKRGEIYWIAFYAHGTEYRTSAKTEKKRAAENLLSRSLGQVARGEFTGFPKPQVDTRLTLDDLLTLTLPDAEVKGLRDLYHMRFRAEHLKRFFGTSTPVETLTETDVAKYVAHRRHVGKALSTINRELAVLRQSSHLAKKRRLLKEMPDIPRYTEHNIRQVFFDAETYEAVLTHLPPVLQDLVRFAYLTGWRRGQIIALEWKDIQQGVIRLSGATVKSKDTQVLSLVGELAEVIDRRRQERHPTTPGSFIARGGPFETFVARGTLPSKPQE
jgi:integrase